MILALFEQWGDVDLSHRKLARRGSYTDRVLVSPSTVDRVLARNVLRLQGIPRPARTAKTPWTDWVPHRWHGDWRKVLPPLEHPGLVVCSDHSGNDGRLTEFLNRDRRSEAERAGT